jgi:hypothetical protein
MDMDSLLVTDASRPARTFAAIRLTNAKHKARRIVTRMLRPQTIAVFIDKGSATDACMVAVAG